MLGWGHLAPGECILGVEWVGTGGGVGVVGGGGGT